MVRCGAIVFPVLSVLLLASSLPVAADPLVDLAHDEVRLNEGISQVEAPASLPRAFGLPDGQVCVLYLEGFRLRALHSDDGGLAFEPEVDVVGPPASPEVFFYEAALSDDGELWVAAAVADLGGQRALRVVRSQDMGRTWSEPRILVGPDDPGYGVSWTSPWRHLAVDAAGAGYVSIAYFSGYDTGLFTATTVDGGATWNHSARLDLLPSGDDGSKYAHDLGIDRSTGLIHVVFSLDAELWTTRSLDHGATFEEPLSLEETEPYMEEAYNVDLAIAADGSVLIVTPCELFDPYYWSSPATLLVFRSSDGGSTYEKVFEDGAEWGTNSWSYFWQARVVTDPATSTVLVAYEDAYELKMYRSEDHGATFVPAENPEYCRPVPWNPEEISIARSAAGNWALAWIDERYPTGPGVHAYARFSSDDGRTWGQEVRLNSVAGAVGETAGHEHRLTLTALGPDGFVAAFPDMRGDNRNIGVYAATIPAADPSSLIDRKIDAQGRMVEAPAGFPGALVVAGGMVFVVFAEEDEPGELHWFVRSSADSGETFSDPVRIGSPLEDWPYLARLAATDDGHLVLAYVVFGVNDWGQIQMQVRCNRSSDGGETWLGEDVLVDSPRFIRSATFDLVVDGAGRAHMVWEEAYSRRSYYARSEEGGEAFQVSLIDDADVWRIGSPAICESAGRLFQAWMVDADWYADGGVFSRFSEDGGLNFSEPELLSNSMSVPEILCDDQGSALVAWSTSDYSTTRLWTARFDGSAWGSPMSTVTPAGLSDDCAPLIHPTDDPSRVVALLTGSREVYAALSGDRGDTFPLIQRLDDGLPDPTAYSRDARTAADGEGNLWVTWEEPGSIVTRRSGDAGETFAPARRVSREPVPGFFHNSLFPNAPSTAALDGVGMFAWTGERDSPFAYVLFNLDSPGGPPVADAGVDMQGECESPLGASLILDGTGSSDPDSTPGTNDDIVEFAWFEGFGLPSETALGTGETLPVSLALGEHLITLRVTDDQGLTSADDVLVTVVDTTPPEITVSLDPELLWPPNHRLVDVRADVSATDLCGTAEVALVSVTSNEPDDAHGTGDGNTDGDIQGADVGTPDFDLLLRAERSGAMDGRIYEVVYSAGDESGNRSEAAGSVLVPHLQDGAGKPWRWEVQGTAGGVAIGSGPETASPPQEDR